jgi:hypothetical protein
MANENEVKMTIDVTQAKQALNDLLSTTAKLNSSLANDTSKQIKNIGTEGGISFGKLAGAIGLATGAYQLAIQAAQKLFQIMKESIDSYSKEESFQQRIGGALKDNALLTERMIRLRDQLNKNPLFTKEQISSAVEYATSLGRNEKQTRQLIIAAEGLSRLTGEDLNSSVEKLNGSYNGITGRMGKYIDGIKSVSKEQMANGKIVEMAAAQLGKYGEMSGATETAQDKLKKRFAETEETIGKKLAPTLLVLLDGFGKLMDWVEKVGTSLGHLGTRLWDFLNKYLKPVVVIVTGAVEAFKFLAGAVGNFYIWLDKVTMTDAEKKAKLIEDVQAKQKEDYQKSLDNYRDLDDKHKKELIEKEKSDIEDHRKLNTQKDKDFVTMHEKFLKDVANMDSAVKGGEKDPAAAKKAEEAAKKAIEQQQKILKSQQDFNKASLEQRIQNIDEELKLETDPKIIDGYIKAKQSVLTAYESMQQKELEKEKDLNIKSGMDKVEAENTYQTALLTLHKDVTDQMAKIDTTAFDDKKKLNEKAKEDYLKTLGDQMAADQQKQEDAQKALEDRLKKDKQDLEDFYKQSTDSAKDAIGSLDSPFAQVGQDLAQLVEDVKTGTGDLTKDITKLATSVANTISGQIFSNASKAIQKQLTNTLDAIDKSTEKEQTSLDKLLKNKYISDAEYATRKAALDKNTLQQQNDAKKEAAKKDKKNAEEQALIAALLGAVMALSSGSKLDPAYGIIMAAIVLALGLADVALIASAPLVYKQGTSKVPGNIPRYASGGFTSPNGDQNGIVSLLHPNEGVFNATAMSSPGMPQLVDSANKGQPIQTTTVLHPDSISKIVNGINNKQVTVTAYDINKVQNKVSVLQGRSTL